MTHVVIDGDYIYGVPNAVASSLESGYVALPSATGTQASRGKQVGRYLLEDLQRPADPMKNATRSITRCNWYRGAFRKALTKAGITQQSAYDGYRRVQSELLANDPYYRPYSQYRSAVGGTGERVRVETVKEPFVVNASNVVEVFAQVLDVIDVDNERGEHGETSTEFPQDIQTVRKTFAHAFATVRASRARFAAQATATVAETSDDTATVAALTE